MMKLYECNKCGEFFTYSQLPNRSRGQRVRKGCPNCGGKLFTELEAGKHNLVYLNQTLYGIRLYKCSKCGDLIEKDGICLR